MSVERSAVGEGPVLVQPACKWMRALFPSRSQGVQGTRYRSSVPLGTAAESARSESEARGNQPQATEGLSNVIPAR